MSYWLLLSIYRLKICPTGPWRYKQHRIRRLENEMILSWTLLPRLQRSNLILMPRLSLFRVKQDFLNRYMYWQLLCFVDILECSVMTNLLDIDILSELGFYLYYINCVSSTIRHVHHDTTCWKSSLHEMFSIS